MLGSLKKNHRVAPEVKERIIKRIKEEGVAPAQPAKEHGIHEITVYG
jgi:transposase-like protein